jgi:hypothetical protein
MFHGLFEEDFVGSGKVFHARFAWDIRNLEWRGTMRNLLFLKK